MTFRGINLEEKHIYLNNNCLRGLLVSTQVPLEEEKVENSKALFSETLSVNTVLKATGSLYFPENPTDTPRFLGMISLQIVFRYH